MKYSAKTLGTEMGRIEQERKRRQQEAAHARYQSALMGQVLPAQETEGNGAPGGEWS